MPKNDNAFKAMIQSYAKDYLAQVLPGAVLLDVLSVELPRESLYADALLKVRYRGKIIIVHLEVQTGSDSKMIGRLLQYIGLLWSRDRLTVLPIVIYLFPSTALDVPWQMTGPEGVIVTLNPKVIKLWEVPVSDWPTTAPSGVGIFTPLLKDATVDDFGHAAEALQNIPDMAERDNAINYLTMFAVRQFGEQLVRSYLKEHAMLEQFVMESEWYNSVLREGEQRGEQRSAQRMAQRALEGRFGTVAQDVLEALKTADEATLEAIVLHITTDTLGEIRQRLGLPPNAAE